MSRNQGNRRAKSAAELPTVRIGKKGVTPSFIREISKNLDKRGEVKVKILKTGLGDRTAREIAKDIAEATGSMITQLRGHTFTLRKVKTPKRYL